MAMIECPQCANAMSDRAAACPKCGWTSPTAGATAARAAGVGLLGQPVKMLLAPVAGFAALGLVSLVDADSVTQMGMLAGAALGVALLGLVGHRALNLRHAGDRRLSHCYDIFEIAIVALAISFVGGFWWGFAGEVLGHGRNVREMYASWMAMFGSLSATAALVALVGATLTIATREQG